MSPKKTTPPRPPIKAKSSLPAPRTSQKRVRIPWHQHRTLQVIGAIIVLAVLVLIAWQLHRFWQHHTVTAHNKTAVKAFNDQFQSELTPLENFVNQAQNSPESYANGAITQTAYATQTAQWLVTAETLRNQIDSAKPPTPLKSAAGQLVTAVDVMIDAIKDFQLEGTTTDKNAVLTLAQNGTNELAHGLSVLENASTAEDIVVHDYHLALPSGLTPAILQSPLVGAPEVEPISSPTASPTP